VIEISAGARLLQHLLMGYSYTCTECQRTEPEQRGRLIPTMPDDWCCIAIKVAGEALPRLITLCPEHSPYRAVPDDAKEQEPCG
jgi:hypothetical protein